MSMHAIHADFPELPPDFSPIANTHATLSISTTTADFATAFQMVSGPLCSSLPKRTIVDLKNGDLYASKSSVVLKKRGWLYFEREQGYEIAKRVTTVKTASRSSLPADGFTPPQAESRDDTSKFASIFTQFHEARIYSERAKELWSIVKAYELQMETRQKMKIVKAATIEELDRTVLEDVLEDVEEASKKDSTLLDHAAHEDLKQMRMMLDMSRDASLYAKEAEETYELLLKKMADEGVLEQTEATET